MKIIEKYAIFRKRCETLPFYSVFTESRLNQSSKRKSR
jgi:hypothetical protein